MRVPTDIPLDRWIRHLYSINDIVKFYATEDWKELREDVLEEYHYECQDCLKKEPAEYTKAVTVHHENEVRYYPRLALSKTYVDTNGNIKRNLTPLCSQCHNIRHDRFSPAEKRKQLNIERW